MQTTPGSRNNGQAVAWLATCLTLTAGVGACTLIAIAMQADLTGLWQTAGPLVGGFLLLWWLLRDRSPGNRQADRWGWLKRRPSKKTQLVLTRPKSNPQGVPPPRRPSDCRIDPRTQGGPQHLGPLRTPTEPTRPAPHPVN